MILIYISCLVISIATSTNAVPRRLNPQCRSNVCDDRPECPRTSCRCLFPSRMDCAVYYQCLNGKPIQYRCSPGLFFNNETLSCDYSYNVNCIFSTNNPSSTEVLNTTSTAFQTTAAPAKSSSTEITEEDFPTTEKAADVITTKTTSETPTIETTKEELTTTIKTTELPTTSKSTSGSSTTETTAVTTSKSITSETEEELTTRQEVPTTTSSISEITTAKTTEGTTPENITSEPAEESTTTEIPIRATSISESTTTEISKVTTSESISSDTVEESTTRQEVPITTKSISESTTLEVTEETSTVEQTTKAPVTTSSKSTTETTREREATTKVLTTSSTTSTMSTESPTTTNNPLATNSTFTTTETEITSTTRYPEFLCPTRFGLFADPKSCNRFYHCSHWTPYHKWCPSNLHFNPRLKVCDWPYRAGCDSVLPTPYEPEATSPTPDSNSTYGTCDCDSCQLPVPGDCTAYILCIDNVAFKMHCGPDLYFNPMTGTCDFRENVDCKEDEARCPDQSGRYLLEGSCSYFVECHNGEETIRNCPEGLQFNQSSEMCSWSGSCSGRPDTAPGSKIITDNTICNGCDYCFKPFITDCARYVRCFQGVATEERCAPGLSFNSNTEMCDHDYNVECPDPQTQPGCPEIFGYFPYPGECGMYLHCINGSAAEKTCPGVLHFNPTKKYCDWPWAAGCSDSDSRPTPEPNPGVIDCDCDCCFKPVGTDCSSFILCINQVGFNGSCSSGLRFNPQTENCDFAENVDCPLIPEIPGYDCPKHQGLFPHPEDCEKFIHCAHGFPYVKDCPSNLHFNPKLKVCDWPYSAGCQGLPTIEPPVEDKDLPCDICDSCFIPDMSDCASYIYCRNGTGHRLRCTGDLLFNPDTESCDVASNVNCPNQPSSKCPRPDGLFPAKDCSQFIHCSNGIAYLKDCPDGLHFNAQILVCDWPENVKCGEEPIHPTLPPPDDDDDDDSTSNRTCNCDCCFLPHDKDCSKYILCLDGYMYIGQCSRGLLFNPSIQNCDYAERVTCGEKSPLCPEPNGLFPNPEQCSSYLKCSNGVSKVEYCQNNMHFSINRKQCLDPCEALCDSSYNCDTSSSTTPAVPLSSTLSPYCLEKDGLFPNKDDCTSFYQCSYGRAYLVLCPPGLHFSDIDKVCEYPCEAKCDSTINCNSPSPTTAYTTPVPLSTTLSPYCLEKDGFFPNKDDCASFYQCSNGRAYHVLCPPGLHFSEVDKDCEYPCDAKCNLTIDCNSPSSTTTSTTPAVHTSTTLSPYCLEKDGLFPNKDDCTSFYQCSDGRAYLVLCPSGLHFSDVDKNCEYPCEAKCNSTIDCNSPSPAPTLPTSTTLSPYCLEKEGLFPNKDDCTSFYECTDGKAYLLLCPPGLHFSDIDKDCEYPCEAKCNLTIDCDTSSSTTSTHPSSTTLSPYCPARDGLFPNEDDCSSLYKCSDGRAHLIKCPSGLHFSNIHKICEYPCEAKCDRTLDCSTTTQRIISTPSPHCLTPDGLNPVLGDCTAFYLCSNGKEYLIHCPPGLHFSELHETCETPCLAQCNASLNCGTTVNPMSSTPLPISPECKEPSGLFPNPDDCGSFYQCSEGRGHLIRCPSGLHFSLEDLACERPCVAGCDISIECPPEIPDTKGNCTCDACYLPDPADCSAFYFCDHGQLSKSYCPFGTLFSKESSVCEDESEVDCEANGDPSMCPEPFGFFPYPGDCKKFVHCDDGIAHIKKCQGELEYDPTNRVCTKPKGYCDEVVVDPNCPEPTGMYPDPTDCSLFYHCEHGVAYLKRCSSPLMFNPEKKVCDWPQNVDCGKEDTKSSTTVVSTTSKEPTVNVSTPNVTPSTSPTPSTSECYEVPGVICPCACRVPTYDECSSYFQCREDGTACKEFCPEGLYFNKREMVCDLPENVECRDFFFTSIRRAKLFSHRLRS